MFEYGEIYKHVVDTLLNNEFGSAAFVMGALATIWTTVKGWPIFIFNRIKRRFNFSITVEQSDEMYSILNDYIRENYSHKMKRVEFRLREIYNEGINYEEDIETYSQAKKFPLSDYFYIIYNQRLIKIEHRREKIEGARDLTNSRLGSIEISGFLAERSVTKFIQSSIKLKEEKVRNKGTIKVYDYYNGAYDYKINHRKVLKTMDKLFFDKKDDIIQRIDTFINKKDLYERNGINWSLGILLHGKPGTAKTSFIMALAEYLDRDVYCLNMANLNNSSLKIVINNANENSIILFDDADIGLPNREVEQKSGVTLNTILNLLSGVNTRDGLIFAMTTNDLSKFDDALLRKGRIDILEELKYPTKENICNYLENFYGENVKVSEIKLKKFVSMAGIEYICITESTLGGAILEINKL